MDPEIELLRAWRAGDGKAGDRLLLAYHKLIWRTVATKVDTGVAIVPAKRPITIRDLLTHTAGISYGTESHVAKLYEAKGLGPAAGYGWYTADKDEPICATMERLGTLPAVPTVAESREPAAHCRAGQPAHSPAVRCVRPSPGRSHPAGSARR